MKHQGKKKQKLFLKLFLKKVNKICFRIYFRRSTDFIPILILFPKMSFLN